MNWNGLELPDTPFSKTDTCVNYCADCLNILPQLPDNCVDLIATDPPYGIGFMGKDWDKALPDKQIWAECFRVLKDGAFAFVMSIPRADCLSRMIINLEDAGFRVDFTPMFHCFASGFPKAENIGKAADKRLGVERERGKLRTDGRGKWDLKMNRERGDTGIGHADGSKQIYIEEFATSPQAKALDGSYGGFQPKPAVEVVIVAMKPLSEKTFVDQALKNRKGITWLDGGRIPTEGRPHRIKTVDKGNENATVFQGKGRGSGWCVGETNQGRFCANLLVSDDVLNDGRVRTSGKDCIRRQDGTFVEHFYGDKGVEQITYGDSGSFSRYFDLDKWFEDRIKKLPASVQRTFPFLIVPKASKGEKNRGLGGIEPIQTNDGRNKLPDNAFQRGKTYRNNSHPTVKPLKLMSYLITLGSRGGDIVLDPFVGSGTTMLACQIFGRKCLGIEINEKYCEIAAKRCSQSVMRLEV